MEQPKNAYKMNDNLFIFRKVHLQNMEAAKSIFNKINKNDPISSNIIDLNKTGIIANTTAGYSNHL